MAVVDKVGEVRDFLVVEIRKKSYEAGSCRYQSPGSRRYCLNLAQSNVSFSELDGISLSQVPAMEFEFETSH
jgi:hypothetical protein